jgi:hypothetical protein
MNACVGEGGVEGKGNVLFNFDGTFACTPQHKNHFASIVIQAHVSRIKFSSIQRYN